MNQRITVLLADDHAIVRMGYAQLLNSSSDIEVIAEAGNCAETVEMYRAHKPDVVVLDLSMPLDKTTTDVQSTAGGMETIRRLRSHDNKCRILVATALENEPYPSHAVQAGAMGYITKRSASDELVEAIRTIGKGETFFSKSVRQQLGCTDAGSDSSLLSSLTKRELEIFTMLAEGLSVNAVAELVHLSPKTVHSHRANLLRKLNLQSNSDIIHLAMRAGLLQA